VGGALWLFWPGADDVEPEPQGQLEVARTETPPGEDRAGLEQPATNPEWEASVKAARLNQRKKVIGEKRKKQRHIKKHPTIKKATPPPRPSLPERAGGEPPADAARAPIREPAGTAASLPAASDAARSGSTPPTPALAPSSPVPAPAPPTEVALAQPQPVGEETQPWKRPFVAAQEPEETAPEGAAQAHDADAAHAGEDSLAPPAALPDSAEAPAPAATAESPPLVVANVAPGSGLLEPSAAAPGTVDMGAEAVEPPSQTAEESPTAQDAAPPSGRKRLTTAPPTRLSRAERLEELKRQRAIPREDAAEATAPRATPPPPLPSAEPEGEKVLQRLPSGAPKVRVNFLFYSREPARRRIMVTVDNGSLQTLFEGQSVDTLGVERILPNEVHFRYDGKLFAVRPRY
jgi:hypothetical protein